MKQAWVVLTWVGGKPKERGRCITWSEADELRKQIEAEENGIVSIDDMQQWEREQRSH